MNKEKRKSASDNRGGNQGSVIVATVGLLMISKIAVSVWVKLR